jgi:hypothetical protein
VKDPETPVEWQFVADRAAFLLQMNADAAYGLVRGTLEIDIERCQQIVARAAKRGIKGDWLRGLLGPPLDEFVSRGRALRHEQEKLEANAERLARDLPGDGRRKRRES